MGKLEITPIQLDHSELVAAGEDVRKMITNCNFDMEKVFKLLSNKTWNEERVKYFLNLLNQEKSKLVYGSLVQHNSELGETITRSGWLLKLVLGTSELNTMKYPLLQLILSTVNTNGEESNKMFELNKSMVLKTIQTLEQLTGDISSAD